MDHPALRSFLYAPAHRARLVEKVLGGQTGADAVIVDLEDGVPVHERPAAEQTLRSCADTGSPDLPVLCRIRAGTDARRADVALVPRWFSGVLLAEAEEPDDVQHVADTIRERGAAFDIWLLVESARGVECLSALLAAPAPITGVMLGAGDLRADLGLLDDTDHRQLDAARSRMVFAAAAGFAHVIDTPEAEIEPGEPFLLWPGTLPPDRPGRLQVDPRVPRATCRPPPVRRAEMATVGG